METFQGGAGAPEGAREQTSAEAREGRRSSRLLAGHRSDGRGRAVYVVGGPCQGGEDLTDRVRILHGGNQAQAPVAARAREHIDVEGAPHELGPGPMPGRRR